MQSKVYYVYIHTLLDTGSVFYVGKGSGNRLKTKTGRNYLWKRVVKRDKWIASKVQDNMSERDAFFLEEWLIAKFRHEGAPLTNLTDGGEGVGYRSVKNVFCSNGMEFNSILLAEKWCRSEGWENATASSIYDRCRGRRGRVYGHYWSYEPIKEYDSRSRWEISGDINSKKLFCSNGMSFKNGRCAAEWIIENKGIHASKTNISSAANGSTKTAYGFSWWYEGDKPREYVSIKDRMTKDRGIAVIRSDGVSFESLSEAARSVNGSVSQVHKAAKKIIKTSYGYTWSFA